MDSHWWRQRHWEMGRGPGRGGPARGCAGARGRRGHVGVDELALAACCLAQAQGCEPVEVAMRPQAGLVQQGDGFAGGEFPVTPGQTEAVAQVVG